MYHSLTLYCMVSVNFRFFFDFSSSLLLFFDRNRRYRCPRWFSSYPRQGRRYGWSRSSERFVLGVRSMQGEFSFSLLTLLLFLFHLGPGPRTKLPDRLTQDFYSGLQAHEEPHCDSGNVGTYNGFYSRQEKAKGYRSFGGYGNYHRAPGMLPSSSTIAFFRKVVLTSFLTAHFVIPIPKGVDPAHAAPLM